MRPRTKRGLRAPFGRPSAYTRKRHSRHVTLPSMGEHVNPLSNVFSKSSNFSPRRENMRRHSEQLSFRVTPKQFQRLREFRAHPDESPHSVARRLLIARLENRELEELRVSTVELGSLLDDLINVIGARFGD